MGKLRVNPKREKARHQVFHGATAGVINRAEILCEMGEFDFADEVLIDYVGVLDECRDKLLDAMNIVMRKGNDEDA